MSRRHGEGFHHLTVFVAEPTLEDAVAGRSVWVGARPALREEASEA